MRSHAALTFSSSCVVLVAAVGVTLIASTVAARPAPPPGYPTAPPASDDDELREETQLRRQWGECGCAALEMACEDAHVAHGPAAVAACTFALAPGCDAKAVDSKPREECVRLLDRQVRRPGLLPTKAGGSKSGTVVTLPEFDEATGEAIVTVGEPVEPARLRISSFQVPA